MPTIEKPGNLFVKSFFAASVLAAMEQARRELGPDALLLNSREAPPESRYLGEYEVVFGKWPDAPAPAPAPAAVPSRGDQLHTRIHEIRQMIGRVPPAPPQPEETPALANTLMDAGVERELAQAIARGVERRMSKPARGSGRPQDVQAAMLEELAARFDVRPEIGRITALVGPPGVGKTTTLVKLAVGQCIRQGRAVKLISADNQRIGGADQLRTYASILGVPFQAVENVATLAQAVDFAPPDTCLLIDTPGFSASLQQEFGLQLATFFRHRQDIDTHLVLTASMARTDLQNVTDRFAAFHPAKLLFTRLDETSSTATVFCEAARIERPISFLCDGQAVPEDIVAASKDLVIESLVRQLPVSLQAVA